MKAVIGKHKTKANRNDVHAALLAWARHQTDNEEQQSHAEFNIHKYTYSIAARSQHESGLSLSLSVLSPDH